MSTPKSIFGTIAATLLPVMLFSFGVLYGAYHVVSSPQSLKEALSGSGLYESVVAESLQKASADAGNTATGSLPIDDPGVKQAIERALPPEALQQKSEGAIDGFYRWMHGTSNTLDFTIQLEDTKTKLAENLAAYAQQRTAALPVCTNASDQSAVSNPLNARCIPAGYDPARAGEMIKNEILNNKDFLPDTAVPANDLKSDDGQALDQTLHAVPAVYEQVKWAVILSGVIGLLCIIATATLSGSWRAGCRRLAWIMLPVGAISALLAWSMGYAMQKIADRAADGQGLGALQGSIVTTIDSMTQDVRNWWLWYGLALIAAGLAALIMTLILGRRKRAVATQPVHTMPERSPGVSTLNPITTEEARAATSNPVVQSASAPRRPGKGRQVE